jgi:uncharacterized membrane protein/DNA-binding XRE family transcriptional regulator
MKSERERRGWSQARLAELIGTDSGTVSRWERGVTSPSPYFREKLVALLEKDADELGLAADADLPAASAPLTVDLPSRGSRVLACAAYSLGWFSGLLVLFFVRSDRFALFHCLQSIAFFGATFAIVAASALTAPSIEPFAVRAILYVVGSVTALLALITWVLAIVLAARGTYYEVPVVGGLCRRVALGLYVERPADS